MQALTGFVYLWTNLVNGKKYLGSHVGAEDDGYTGSGKVFIRAIQKHGIENFSRKIIESNIPVKLVRNREQHYLDYFGAASAPEFYNLKSKAGGGFEYINNHPDIDLIRKASGEKTKKRIAEQGHPKGMLGKNHSPEHKARMVDINRRALAASIGRPVWSFQIDGTPYKAFSSISEAAREVDGSPSNIKYTCEGKFSSAYGKLWSYSSRCPGIPTANNCTKSVTTPLGDFESISSAAATHAINPLTLKRRILNGVDGYYWKDPQ